MWWNSVPKLSHLNTLLTLVVANQICPNRHYRGRNILYAIWSWFESQFTYIPKTVTVSDFCVWLNWTLFFHLCLIISQTVSASVDVGKLQTPKCLLKQTQIYRHLVLFYPPVHALMTFFNLLYILWRSTIPHLSNVPSSWQFTFSQTQWVNFSFFPPLIGLFLH